MPYDDVTVNCDVLLCTHNDGDECLCECHMNQLNPDKADCSEFNFDSAYFNANIATPEKRQRMIRAIEQQGIPFLSLDEDAMHFQTVHTPQGDFCLVQGSEEDLANYRFWKHVDGGFGYTHRDQLELSL